MKEIAKMHLDCRVKLQITLPIQDGDTKKDAENRVRETFASDLLDLLYDELESDGFEVSIEVELENFECE